MLFLFEQMTWRWKSYGWLVAAVIGVVAAGCGERVVEAPPPKVVVESSLYRIHDLNVPAGTTSEHSFEHGVATIVMRESGRARTHAPGADWGQETAAMMGNVSAGEAGEHGVQNRGEGDMQLFVVENLRDGGGSKPEPLSGNGVTLAAESASFGVYDVRLTDNNFQISHVHAVPTVTVLVKGKILSQGPESKDEIDKAASGLRQLDQPGQWVFVPPGEAHYVVRLGAEQSHVIEVELR